MFPSGLGGYLIDINDRIIVGHYIVLEHGGHAEAI